MDIVVWLERKTKGELMEQAGMDRRPNPEVILELDCLENGFRLGEDVAP